jgi:hypothetical protein
MPRMLRDWTDSERVNKLTAEGERFFTRLIMKADDYGRYVADPRLLRGYLFPLFDGLKESHIIGWLNECTQADLIHCYIVNGKHYVEIKNYDQKLTIRRSKYPPSDEKEQILLREGYVYLIGTSFEHPVKIGFSVNPWARLKEITINHPEKLELLLTMKGDKTMESEIQNAIKNFRVKNEWFQINAAILECFNSYAAEDLTREKLLVALRSIPYVLRISPELEAKVKEEPEVKNEKSKCAVTAQHTQEDIILFEKLQLWITQYAPRINQMKQKLTIDQYLKIKKRYSKDTIKKVMLAMENRGDLVKKYTSANLTIQSWASKEYNQAAASSPALESNSIDTALLKISKNGNNELQQRQEATA